MLAVEPGEVAAPLDVLLSQTIPDDVEVVRVGGIPRAWTERVGIGSLEARTFVSINRAGSRLLRTGSFDLVFFSTTAMSLTALGPRWKKRFGVPFMVDFQDPWLSDYYDQDGAPAPPGGALKYGVVRKAAEYLEPFVLRQAAHALSVSPAYPEALVARYPWLSRDRFTVLPFGAPKKDFEVLHRSGVTNPVFDSSDGLEHWAYVGRAGDDMAFALGAMFSALARARRDDPERYNRLRIHFVGTSYAEGDRARKTVQPVAVHHGVGDLVDERPHRIPYFQALRVLSDADALLIPGSDDPGYTASKLYPYVLADKPLLAVFHESSSVVDVIHRTRAGTAVTFTSRDTVDEVATRINAEWFAVPLPAVRTDWEAFEPYTARAMAHTQAELFEAVGAVARTGSS